MTIFRITFFFKNVFLISILGQIMFWLKFWSHFQLLKFCKNSKFQFLWTSWFGSSSQKINKNQKLKNRFLKKKIPSTDFQNFSEILFVLPTWFDSYFLEIQKFSLSIQMSEQMKLITFFFTKTYFWFWSWAIFFLFGGLKLLSTSALL